MSKFKIGILGFGTVGSVYNVLLENHDEILAKTGIDFEIVSILTLTMKKLSALLAIKN